MELTDFILKLNKLIVNPFITLLFVVATLMFLWGVFQFIRGADNPGEREKGIQHILWGVFGLFIMVAVFGIIRLLMNTFGINEDAVNTILGMSILHLS